MDRKVLKTVWMTLKYLYLYLNKFIYYILNLQWEIEDNLLWVINENLALHRVAVLKRWWLSSRSSSSEIPGRQPCVSWTAQDQSSWHDGLLHPTRGWFVFVFLSVCICICTLNAICISYLVHNKNIPFSPVLLVALLTKQKFDIFKFCNFFAIFYLSQREQHQHCLVTVISTHDWGINLGGREISRRSRSKIRSRSTVQPNW